MKPFRKAIIAFALACFLTGAAYADKNNDTSQGGGGGGSTPTLLPPVQVPGYYGDPYLALPPFVTLTPGALNPHWVKPPFLPTSRGPNNSSQKNTNCDKQVGDPIDASTGAKKEAETVFALPGEMGLRYVRYYNQQNVAGPWTDNLDYFLDVPCWNSPGTPSTSCGTTYLRRPDGVMVNFIGDANATGNVLHETSNGIATLVRLADGSHVLHDEDGTILTFGPDTGLRAITDTAGIGWTVQISNQTANLTSNSFTQTVTHTNGQSFTIAKTYQQGYSTATVTDPAGNVYHYTTTVANGSAYTHVSYPGSPAYSLDYRYDPSQSALLTEVDINGAPYSITSYDSAQRASGTHFADGSENITISYGANATGPTATITNALGHQTIKQFDAGTNLISNSEGAVASCGASTHSYIYDTNGNIQQSTDNNGNITRYSYAANGQLQSKTEAYNTPQARTTDYVWDPDPTLNRMLSITIEGYSKTTYTYNAQNRLASVARTNLTGNGSSGQALTTTYSYTLYGNGMVQSMTVTKPSPNGEDTRTYQYDTLGHLITETNGLGQKTTYSNYNALGEVGTVTGPNGDTTGYTYDVRGRMLSKTTSPNGGTWNYAYDGFGLLASLAAPDGEVTKWVRNSAMRVTSITHNDKDGISTESFTYDVNGDITQHSISRGNTIGFAESYTYDTLGRVYQRFGQNGQSHSYTYDGNGNVLSVTTAVNAIGHTVSYQYDALNRVVKTLDSGGASPPMPSAAATPNAPTSSLNGAYTISWNSVSYATHYVLQEQINGGAWTTVQDGSALSWSTTGRTGGTYSYREQACNATGCGTWSPVVSIQVGVDMSPIINLILDDN